MLGAPRRRWNGRAAAPAASSPDIPRLGRLALFALACSACSGCAQAQGADQEVVSVLDAPDPIVPGGTLTYSVTMRNHGPDAAGNGGLDVSFDQDLTYLGNAVPAGRSCRSRATTSATRRPRC